MPIDAEYDPIQILEGLNGSDYHEFVTHLTRARVYILSALPSDQYVELITGRAIELAGHPKWEVKMAVAELLGVIDLQKSKEALELLSQEPVQFVRNAANKALRDSKRVTTRISQKADPTADRLFTLIRKMNPRNVREAYAAAMQVGQIFYRELASVTTHELRNYLRIIYDRLESIEKSLSLYPNPSANEDIVKARQTMQELIEVIDRLAFLSRDPGPVEVFEVFPVIREAIEEARAEVRQDGHECKDVREPLQSVGVTLKGDRLQLKTALRNLIINAIEASPSDEFVDVTMDIDGDYLKICIRDRGYGMTEQEITSCFKIFTTTKKESDGMGLGVPIAQKVIHFDFGGEIRYESELDKGTRVFVELPIYMEDAL